MRILTRNTSPGQRNARPTAAWSMSTSSGFPPDIPGLGRFGRIYLDRCVDCGDITSLGYGNTLLLCCLHARERYEVAMQKAQEERTP